jgi:hypothetical protein
MLPAIGLVQSVEMIRDGGSLGASFDGTDGSAYSLLFKVRIGEPSGGSAERLGYEEPVIFDSVSRQEIQISWKHAQVLLSQIERLVDNEESLKWLRAMQEVVVSRGGLPSAVSRSFDGEQ